MKYFTTVKNQEENIVFAGIITFESETAAEVYKNQASSGGNTVLLVFQPAE